ncbi:hypothetical protein EYF80_052224 [Liparis tanakae]|uniref:Uncharacterized protein n=1 Tax=Liparis tanakae TaxID=230148 RepID=A0A4Z2FB55_9TELE|nr:hypothetical protein EYF80_052224 [Liparis tanakae]
MQRSLSILCTSLLGVDMVKMGNSFSMTYACEYMIRVPSPRERSHRRGSPRLFNMFFFFFSIARKSA